METQAASKTRPARPRLARDLGRARAGRSATQAAHDPATQAASFLFLGFFFFSSLLFWFSFAVDEHTFSVFFFSFFCCEHTFSVVVVSYRCGFVCFLF